MSRSQCSIPRTAPTTPLPSDDDVQKLHGSELDAAIEQIEAAIGPHVTLLKKLRKRRAALMGAAASAEARRAKLPAAAVQQTREGFNGIRGSVDYLQGVYGGSKRNLQRKLTGR